MVVPVSATLSSIAEAESSPSPACTATAGTHHPPETLGKMADSGPTAKPAILRPERSPLTPPKHPAQHLSTCGAKDDDATSVDSGDWVKVSTSLFTTPSPFRRTETLPSRRSPSSHRRWYSSTTQDAGDLTTGSSRHSPKASSLSVPGHQKLNNKPTSNLHHSEHLTKKASSHSVQSDTITASSASSIFDWPNYDGSSDAANSTQQQQQQQDHVDGEYGTGPSERPQKKNKEKRLSKSLGGILSHLQFRRGASARNRLSLHIQNMPLADEQQQQQQQQQQRQQEDMMPLSAFPKLTSCSSTDNVQTMTKWGSGSNRRNDSQRTREGGSDFLSQSYIGDYDEDAGRNKINSPNAQTIFERLATERASSPGVFSVFGSQNAPISAASSSSMYYDSVPTSPNQEEEAADSAYAYQSRSPRFSPLVSPTRGLSFHALKHKLSSTFSRSPLSRHAPATSLPPSPMLMRRSETGGSNGSGSMSGNTLWTGQLGAAPATASSSNIHERMQYKDRGSATVVSQAASASPTPSPAGAEGGSPRLGREVSVDLVPFPAQMEPVSAKTTGRPSEAVTSDNYQQQQRQHQQPLRIGRLADGITATTEVPIQPALSSGDAETKSKPLPQQIGRSAPNLAFNPARGNTGDYHKTPRTPSNASSVSSSISNSHLVNPKFSWTTPRHPGSALLDGAQTKARLGSVEGQESYGDEMTGADNPDMQLHHLEDSRAYRTEGSLSSSSSSYSTAATIAAVPESPPTVPPLPQSVTLTASSRQRRSSQPSQLARTATTNAIRLKTMSGNSNNNGRDSASSSAQSSATASPHLGPTSPTSLVMANTLPAHSGRSVPRTAAGDSEPQLPRPPLSPLLTDSNTVSTVAASDNMAATQPMVCSQQAHPISQCVSVSSSSQFSDIQDEISLLSSSSQALNSPHQGITIRTDVERGGSSSSGGFDDDRLGTADSLSPVSQRRSSSGTLPSSPLPTSAGLTELLEPNSVRQARRDALWQALVLWKTKADKDLGNYLNRWRESDNGSLVCDEDDAQAADDDDSMIMKVKRGHRQSFSEIQMDPARTEFRRRILELARRIKNSTVSDLSNSEYAGGISAQLYNLLTEHKARFPGDVPAGNLILDVFYSFSACSQLVNQLAAASIALAPPLHPMLASSSSAGQGSAAITSSGGASGSSSAQQPQQQPVTTTATYVKSARSSSPLRYSTSLTEVESYAAAGGLGSFSLSANNSPNSSLADRGLRSQLRTSAAPTSGSVAPATATSASKGATPAPSNQSYRVSRKESTSSAPGATPASLTGFNSGDGTRPRSSTLVPHPSNPRTSSYTSISAPLNRSSSIIKDAGSDSSNSTPRVSASLLSPRIGAVQQESKSLPPAVVSSSSSSFSSSVRVRDLRWPSSSAGPEHQQQQQMAASSHRLRKISTTSGTSDPGYASTGSGYNTPTMNYGSSGSGWLAQKSVWMSVVGSSSASSSREVSPTRSTATFGTASENYGRKSIASDAEVDYDELDSRARKPVVASSLPHTLHFSRLFNALDTTRREQQQQSHPKGRRMHYPQRTESLPSHSYELPVSPASRFGSPLSQQSDATSIIPNIDLPSTSVHVDIFDQTEDDRVSLLSTSAALKKKDKHYQDVDAARQRRVEDKEDLKAASTTDLPAATAAERTGLLSASHPLETAFHVHPQAWLEGTVPPPKGKATSTPASKRPSVSLLTVKNGGDEYAANHDEATAETEARETADQELTADVAPECPVDTEGETVAPTAPITKPFATQGMPSPPLDDMVVCRICENRYRRADLPSHSRRCALDQEHVITEGENNSHLRRVLNAANAHYNDLLKTHRWDRHGINDCSRVIHIAQRSINLPQDCMYESWLYARSKLLKYEGKLERMIARVPALSTQPSNNPSQVDVGSSSPARLRPSDLGPSAMAGRMDPETLWLVQKLLKALREKRSSFERYYINLDEWSREYLDEYAYELLSPKADAALLSMLNYKQRKQQRQLEVNAAPNTPSPLLGKDNWCHLQATSSSIPSVPMGSLDPRHIVPSSSQKSADIFGSPDSTGGSTIDRGSSPKKNEQATTTRRKRRKSLIHAIKGAGSSSTSGSSLGNNSGNTDKASTTSSGTPSSHSSRNVISLFAALFRVGGHKKHSNYSSLAAPLYLSATTTSGATQSSRQLSGATGSKRPSQLGRHQSDCLSGEGASALVAQAKYQPQSPKAATYVASSLLSDAEHLPTPSVTAATSGSDKQRRSSGSNRSTMAKLPSIKDFEFIKPISRGAYGRVYLVRKKTTNDLYAIKVMRKSDMIHKNMVSQVLTERRALSLLQTPWVVRLFYAFDSRRHLFLVMDYLVGGDLAGLLQVWGVMEDDAARFYTAETACALEYLHRNGITHRDLKPDNLLVSADGHIKLTDFGLSQITVKDGEDTWSDMEEIPDRLSTARRGPKGSRTRGHTRASLLRRTHGKASAVPSTAASMVSMSSAMEERSARPPPTPHRNVKRNNSKSSRRFLGTPDYLAPELLLGTGNDNAVDWWALGVCLFEFLTGYPPFTDESPEAIFKNILNHAIDWPEEEGYIPDDAITLINTLLNPEPAKRGGYREIQESTFFSEIDLERCHELVPPFIPEPEDDIDTSYFEARTRPDMQRLSNATFMQPDNTASPPKPSSIDSDEGFEAAAQEAHSRPQSGVAGECAGREDADESDHPNSNPRSSERTDTEVKTRRKYSKARRDTVDSIGNSRQQSDEQQALTHKGQVDGGQQGHASSAVQTPLPNSYYSRESIGGDSAAYHSESELPASPMKQRANMGISDSRTSQLSQGTNSSRFQSSFRKPRHESD
ncbi:hypothetical protein EV182_000714, partial [Spiromyces aspiralis]